MQPSVFVGSFSKAKAAGAKFYSSGRPCKHGHVGVRRVVDGYCCECAKTANEKYRRAHPEKRSEYAKRRYQEVIADESLNARRKEHAEKYRRSHREDARKRASNWRSADPERAKLSRNESRARNPHPHREAARRRKMLKRKVAGSHTLGDRREILAAQKNRCALCRCRFTNEVRPTVDHIVAIKRGGTDNRSNIQLLCGPCNSGKCDKEQLEYARTLGRLL